MATVKHQLVTLSVVPRFRSKFLSFFYHLVLSRELCSSLVRIHLKTSTYSIYVAHPKQMSIIIGFKLL